jgi:phage-related minor tail protein
LSVSSVGSFSTKESKRATKLQEAQAELLGCEEHLRGLEVRIESERNNVMANGLEERFRAMEAVGRMWVRQAKRGLEDMEKHSGMSTNYLRDQSANGQNYHATHSS